MLLQNPGLDPFVRGDEQPPLPRVLLIQSALAEDSASEERSQNAWGGGGTSALEVPTLKKWDGVPHFLGLAGHRISPNSLIATNGDQTQKLLLRLLASGFKKGPGRSPPVESAQFSLSTQRVEAHGRQRKPRL